MVRGLTHPAPRAGHRPVLHRLAPAGVLTSPLLLLLAFGLVHHVAALEDAEPGGELAQLVELGRSRGQRVIPRRGYEVRYRYTADGVGRRLDRVAHFEAVDRSLAVVGP